MVEPNKIRLACYESADGPRVMLFGPMEVELTKLRDCFASLGKVESKIDLDSLPFVHPGKVRLTLISVGRVFDSKHERTEQGIRRIADSRQSFAWRRTLDGWEYLAELMDGLIQLRTPGHQYLTRYPDEDAIVVVSKGEYTDDVLDQS